MAALHNLNYKHIRHSVLNNSMLKTLVFICLISIPAVVAANTTPFQHVKNAVFWQQLYTEKHHTLYCAMSDNTSQDVTVGHVYPMAWMANAMNCPSENQCEYARYKEASADLHNLWPVAEKSLQLRQHYLFIESDKNSGEANYCNFTIFDRGIEPREFAKGEIARSMLYLIWQYQLPDYGQLPLMLKWHKRYRPNAEETWRNERIMAIQGKENPFITNPGFADEVFSAVTDQ